MNSKQKIFWILTALSIILIFVANYFHLNQQGIYSEFYQNIAQNILHCQGYSVPAFSNEPLFYPMWGYTFLVLIDAIFGNTSIIILLFQALLAFAGIFYFYKIFAIEKKLFHILLFIPFIALMSVKWPDAIVGFLLLPFAFYNKEFIENPKLRTAIIAGIIFGVLCNFRSEYLLIPFIQFAFIIVPKIRNNFIPLAKFNIIVLVITVICLTPWAIRSYVLSGELRYSSSNSGMVFYLSLGQLPNNKWKIAPIDKTAIDLVESQGNTYPFSSKGDRILKDNFIKSVQAEPAEFIKKIFYNGFKSFTGGVYTGEYSTFFIQKNRLIKIQDSINSTSGTMNKLKNITILPASESTVLLTEKLIQIIFSIVFFLSIIFLVFFIFSKSFTKYLSLKIVVTSIFIYKIISVSLIQYEYRHMNAVYVLLLGIALITASELFSRKFKKS
ncbi:MAG: hypothetical protein WCT77_07640 [Bacteroidota bacterium]|jgi:hypothetical protein